MRITKIASTCALCAALQVSPLVVVLLAVLLVVAAAVFLRWFVQQPKLARADVIRLLKAVRGS